MNPETIAAAIERELERARSKFPTWPEDLIHAAAIVGEESGELTQATLNYTYHRGGIAEVQKEAIHTAAMAMRFLENLK